MADKYPLQYIKINGAFPPRYAWPQWFSVTYSETTARSLNYMPVGAQGFPSIILSWDRMRDSGLRYWLNLIPAGKRGVQLTSIELANYPTRTSIEEEVEMPGGGTYVFPHYNEWESGILEFPVWGTDVYAKVYGLLRDRTFWVEGSHSITISRVGAPTG